MAKNYYAIKKGHQVGIFESWDECKSLVEGFSGAQYKSFKSMDDAKNYLNNLVQNEPTYESYAFVDGSFNQTTNTYGFGGFLKHQGEEYILQGSGAEPERASMRNVAGELDGAMAAVLKALKLGITELALYYDYQGVESWVTGAWKTGNNFTKRYAHFMDEAQKRMTIIFVKVAGHTGVPGNERADRLAKKAVGL